MGEHFEGGTYTKRLAAGQRNGNWRKSDLFTKIDFMFAGLTIWATILFCYTCKSVKVPTLLDGKQE